MFFQDSGIEVALWIPPLVAFVVSFFTSMGFPGRSYFYLSRYQFSETHLPQSAPPIRYSTSWQSPAESIATGSKGEWYGL